MLGDSLNRIDPLPPYRTPAPATMQELSRVYSRGEQDGEEFAEHGLDIVRYLRTLLRHWLVILAVVVVALGGGVASLLLRQPIYTSTVTMQIDKESQNQVVEASSIRSQEVVASEEFFQTQYGLLRSRSLAARTLDKLGVMQDPTAIKLFGSTSPTGGRAAPAELRRSMLAKFQKSLDVTPVRGSRLVNISFDSPDPGLSARVANAVADNFISSNIERRYEASSYNRTFLEDQLQKEKVKLEAAERQLAAYAKGQQIINISGASEKGSSGSNQSLTASSLIALNNALAEARGDRIRAEAKWRQAEASPGSSMAEVLASPTVQALKEAQAKLETDYQDKLKVFRPGMPEMQQIQARLTENQRQLQTEITSIKNSVRAQYEIARAQEQQFEGQVSQLKGSVLDLRDRSINYDILQREVDTSRELYQGLLQTYSEIGVAGDLRNNNIFIIDRAEAALSPSKPNPALTMLIALGIGLVLGVLAAFLLELLDESIRSPEDVERKLGVPLLGTIPKLAKGVVPLAALGDIRSAFAEAYYSVRTALQFSTNEGVPSSLLVTSARPAEGKSTSARAIAINFARLGRRVLLVDGDLRNPSLHRAFNEENSTGLSNFLTGSASVAQLARQTETPNLFFIPSGPLPPSPAELLATNRIQELLDEAKLGYDILIIDGPPVMGLADAPLLGSIVAGSLLVIEAGGTGRNLAKATLRRLGVGRAKILGVLLTKFDSKKSSYGYGYGYSYAYDYGVKPALKGKA